MGFEFRIGSFMPSVVPSTRIQFCPKVTYLTAGGIHRRVDSGSRATTYIGHLEGKIMPKRILTGVTAIAVLGLSQIALPRSAEATAPTVCEYLYHHHYPYAGVVVKDYEHSLGYPLTEDNRDTTINGAWTTYHAYWGQRNCY
jgi:hypothetical protein